MDDAQRYRTNAAECLSAADRCDLPYRGLTLAIAEAWLSLARQQAAVDEFLVIWSKAGSARAMTSGGQPFQYPRDLHRLPFKMAARRWDAALQERESISS
jgi:hypothetical protein